MVNNLTSLRTAFLDFCDNAEILEHIQHRCRQKGIAQIEGLEECQALYEARDQSFTAEINAGRKTSLPPNNVWLLILESLRFNVPLEEVDFSHLSIVVEFDEQENLGIKYIVNQAESLEDWVSRHPELDIATIRGVFDSFLLEYFDSKDLVVNDNKLFTKKGQNLVNYQNFQRDEKLKNFDGLGAKIANAGLAKNVNIKASSKNAPAARPDSQQF